MAQPTAKPKTVPSHSHPEYQHDGHAHDHELVAHNHEHDHELISHEHVAVPEHEHAHVHPMPRHEHGELRGELRGAVRALLKVFESGSLNSAQRQAVFAARVVIGDARGTGCTHGKDPDGLYRKATYAAGDRLVCDLCGTDITAEAGG